MYISVCLALPLSLPGTYKHLTWLSLTCTRTSGPCDSFGVSPHALAGVRLGRAGSLRGATTSMASTTTFTAPKSRVCPPRLIKSKLTILKAPKAIVPLSPTL